MDPIEILSRIRKIDIKSKAMAQEYLAGNKLSSFLARGMSFSEVRAYQIGDDVRTIDWNVTARTGSPHVKLFEEERQLTLMLLIDVSGSTLSGSELLNKKDFISELSGILSYSALSEQDQVGAILFSDKIETVVQASKKRSQVFNIINHIFQVDNTGKKTNLDLAINYLCKIQKRRCMVIVISDFISDDYQKSLSMAAMRHDVMALRIEDTLDIQLPAVGLLPVKDLENGQIRWIDSSDQTSKTVWENVSRKRNLAFLSACRKAGVNHLTLKPNEHWITKMVGFFQRKLVQ